MMNKSRSRVLFVGQSEGSQEVFNLFSERESHRYDCISAGSVSETRAITGGSRVDIILSDYNLDDGTVHDICDSVRDVPVIIFIAAGDAVMAARAMKVCAYDYILTDSALNYVEVLPLTIDKALERKKVEVRLRLLESAVTNANDAIIILEAEPGQMLGRKILYVNDAFTRMTGYSSEDAMNRTLRILRGPNTDLAALHEIRTALEQVRPVRVELINYRKDGSEFWAECNIVPFADEQGVFKHWVSVQRDITERKQSEQERERLLREIEAVNAHLTELNQELETIGAERTMGLMALTVADRVRNPAAMIGGRCRRILAKEALSESLREGLQSVIEGADKLDRIVKDFETLFKNRQSMFKHVDLNKVVESVVAALEKEAASKNITITVQMPAEPLRMNMQKDLLRVALFHLIKNALEATEGGGMIGVETFSKGESAVLAVSDSGNGIPRECFDDVFRPFFSTKARGFGMGLPLVKQIITEHFGELTVRSRPGEGTTFQILFPLRWKEGSLYREHALGLDEYS